MTNASPESLVTSLWQVPNLRNCYQFDYFISVESNTEKMLIFFYPFHFISLKLHFFIVLQKCQFKTD